MARGVFIVLGDPASEEAEAEFNRWYDEQHLDEVLALPGICAAARYRRLPTPQPSPPGQRYLAVYEIEAEDLADVKAALTAAAPSFEISDALSRDPRPLVLWFEEITERRTTESAPAARRA